MDCCIPTPTTDSNTGTGMPSAAEECHEPSGNCQGISHCLESGHPELNILNLEWTRKLKVICGHLILLQQHLYNGLARHLDNSSFGQK